MTQRTRHIFLWPKCSHDFRLFTSIPFSTKSCTTCPCPLYAAALKATLNCHTQAVSHRLPTRIALTMGMLTLRNMEVIACGHRSQCSKVGGTVPGRSQQLEFAAMTAMQFIRTMGTSRKVETCYAHRGKEMVCNNGFTTATVPRGCPNGIFFFKVGTPKMFATSGFGVGKNGNG